ncbi:hypothetical protein Pst134EA_007126 [Puccinia striiformis f. sp. tritici]|uniref:hypothetical protein n=1 Tax=Puccinia striiformis f. sp. tritici TaxID=168172 RepID=UPI0020081663|nr:hypothetical protein Pst134EA_007126 [Puccinia striiformis f. sp. tritici]KAH9469850.1 hypothetical protein Pst134EA_007126 [Puccinia striiformis f. sp. tritici]
MSSSRTRPSRRSTRTQQQPTTTAAAAVPAAVPTHHHLSPAKLHQPAPAQTAQPVVPLTGSQRLTLLLNGKPHYLDQPGPLNRILLSIKSTLDQDTDYALEVLLAGSSFEPDLIPLSRFPGLVDGLLDLVDSYRSPAIFHDPIQKAVRRRALEATLVLRNLFCLDSNLSNISVNHPRLISLILHGFRHAQTDSDHEFLTLLLEILESLASLNLVRLDQPLRDHQNHNPASETHPNWPSELVWQLDQLTQSSDRALLLAAYRSLSAIGSLAANQIALSTELFKSNTWPTSIERGFTLLALPDVELLMVVLDYLYSLTSTKSIGLSICCLHKDILPVIKLLMVHVNHNSRMERLPIQLLPIIPDQKWYFQPAPITEPIPEEVTQSIYGNNNNSSIGTAATGGGGGGAGNSKTTPQALTMGEVHQILLPERQLKDIVNLTEPNRARQWMSRVFEAYPGGEVQQVTLWLAYKTQFESYQNLNNLTHPNVQMIAPAEAIKLTSDVFPNALPSVTEHKSGEKKFVISGMRVRPKKHAKIWKCQWKECQNNLTEEEIEEIGKGGPSRLNEHIQKQHITPRGNACHWSECTYQGNNRTELILHVRTHILYLPLPSSTTSSSSSLDKGKSNGTGKTGKSMIVEKTENVGGGVGEDGFLPFRTYVHERWETPNTGAYLPPDHHQQQQHSVSGNSIGTGGGAVGIGFVALLVLRNLLSSISDSLGELVKTFDHHHHHHQSGLSKATPMNIDSEDNMDDEQRDGLLGWRMVDISQELVPSSSSTHETTTSSGLTNPQSRLIRLARLLSGSYPPSSSSPYHTDPDITQSIEFPIGLVEKEIRNLLVDGPHFLSLATDLLHLLNSISDHLKHF